MSKQSLTMKSSLLSHQSMSNRSKIIVDTSETIAMHHISGQCKATFDGLQVMITALNRVKPISMSDFDRKDLEILYRVLGFS